MSEMMFASKGSIHFKQEQVMHFSHIAPTCVDALFYISPTCQLSKTLQLYAKNYLF